MELIVMNKKVFEKRMNEVSKNTLNGMMQHFKTEIDEERYKHLMFILGKHKNNPYIEDIIKIIRELHITPDDY